MRATEVTAENLEDLLAYDDVLLDYFNAFLALPVFSLPLYYNRLTGTFEELQSPDGSYSPEQSYHSTPLYGATDEERERIVEWAKTERIPIFFRSHLFCEFKLCRLLLRPLVDHPTAGQSSGNTLRGNSRQTLDSCLSSLSRCANSAKDADLSGSGTGWNRNGSAAFSYKRPGSRAVSLPVYAGLGTVFKRPSNVPGRNNSSKGNAENKSYECQSLHVGHGQIQRNTQDLMMKGSFSNPSYNSEGEKVSSQTEHNNDASKTNPPHPSAEVIQTQTYFNLIDEEKNEAAADGYAILPGDFVLDEMTEEGIKDFEERHRVTLQEMKEFMIGSVQRMENFRSFLQNTSGKYLYEFWLDCELYKDAVEDQDDEENTVIRNRLFRNIHDKYKLTLNSDAVQQFVKAAGQFGLTRSIFDQTQYDTLRRLRAYWILRYLIHKERLGELQISYNHEDYLDQLGGHGMVNSRRSSEYARIFPSVSLVTSLPVIPDNISDFSKSSLDNLKASSSYANNGDNCTPDQLSENGSFERTLMQKCLMALAMEKEAGSPFQFYLQRTQEKKLLCHLLFWEDVRDFSHSDPLSTDRHLRLVHAWDIFNKYLTADSELFIGPDDEDHERIYHVLLPSKHSINVHVFSSIRDRTANLLLDAWISYLKHDLKTFLDHRQKGQPGLPCSLEDIAIMLDKTGQNVVVKHKPRIPTRESSATTTEEQQIQRIKNRQLYLERRRIVEKERQKAIIAARKCQREMKNAQLQGAAETREDDELNAAAADLAIERPDFKSCQNNKRIMSAFKSHLATAENPDISNTVSLFDDIELYLSFGDGLLNQPKKEMQAIHISKSYLQPGSKKRVPLNPIILTRLRNEKDRPKTPTLKDIRNYLLPVIESNFNQFMSLNIHQIGAEGRTASEKHSLHSGGKSRGNSSIKSKAPSLNKQKHYNGRLPPLHLGIEAFPVGGGWTPNTSSFDWYSSILQGNEQLDVPSLGQNQKQTRKSLMAAKITPTKDDRAQFLLALTQAAAGKLPTHMWLYYEYLVQHGEEEGNTRLDRDLFFYCEVFKFKESSHAFADDELLKRKVQSISDCYLEPLVQTKEEKGPKDSPTAQIDVSNEILQKTLKAAQRYVAGKDVSSSIFDDAQGSVFKELLPYWVGFMRNYTPPLQDRTIPLTKQMMERRRKLEEILSWKPPSANTVLLPSLPDGALVASFTFTLNDGFRWKEGRVTDEGSVAGHNSDLGVVGDVVTSTSNIRTRKTSIMSHSTTGDFKTTTRASIVSS